jgi:hypothetical protein
MMQAIPGGTSMRALRLLASVLLPTLAFAAVGQGCIISDCDNGQDNCVEFQTPTRYELEEETLSAPWTAGKAIRVVSANGQVNVVQGNSAEVSATFGAFTLHEEDKEDEARREMTDNLNVEVTDSGSEILVRSATTEDASGGTGADITVRLPAGFDGAFSVVQDNGSVEVDLTGSTPASTSVVNDGAGSLTVYGAQGALEVIASTGDVTLSIGSWPAAGSSGTVFTDNGDIDVDVPATADGTIILSAEGELTENGVPETWTATADGYTMGTGMGGTVDITTDFGDIILNVE